MGAIFLVVIRRLFMACVLSGFGAALFAATLTKGAGADLKEGSRALIEQRVRKVMWFSFAAAILIAIAWLALEAKVMLGATSTNADAPALLACLKSSAARSVFKDQGFRILLSYESAMTSRTNRTRR